MKMVKIFWSLKKADVLEVSIRQRKDEMGNDVEYACFKVGILEDFDEDTLTFIRQRRTKAKSISLMCFTPALFRAVVEGERYSFKGFCSLKYGGVYFITDTILDVLGFDILSPHSFSSEEIKPPDEVESIPF